MDYDEMFGPEPETIIIDAGHMKNHYWHNKLSYVLSFVQYVPLVGFIVKPWLRLYFAWQLRRFAEREYGIARKPLDFWQTLLESLANDPDKDDMGLFD